MSNYQSMSSLPSRIFLHRPPIMRAEKTREARNISFAELDTALAEASYLVNCRPMQPNPAMGEDGFICPNDMMMGRSDKKPPLA